MQDLISVGYFFICLFVSHLIGALCHVTLLLLCKFDSLAPRRYVCNIESIIFKLNLKTDMFCISCEIALRWTLQDIQYIPRNMHTVFALLCFVVVIHWLIFPYPSGSLHWHCGNLTIAPVPAKQSWWIWINTSCEFIMNDCITTTKQSTTKPCAYFLGYTVTDDKSRQI